MLANEGGTSTKWGLSLGGSAGAAVSSCSNVTTPCGYATNRNYKVQTDTKDSTDSLVGCTRNPMVAYRLSKGVDGMGESTREHELGIQVGFFVVYIFRGTNKRQTVSHTGCEISGQISNASRRFHERSRSHDAYKGSPD